MCTVHAIIFKRPGVVDVIGWRHQRSFHTLGASFDTPEK